ncbi:hypothetical protein ABFA07_023305 [Porites harrisoni]
MPSYRELKDKIRVLEEEIKTLREVCGVQSSNRIHLEGKIMEWQRYAEYKKEMLVATMQEREEFKKLYEKTKAENNILEFHLERLQRHYLLLEKGFTSWFRVGQKMYHEYILFKEPYFGLLERYTWETASDTVDNDNITSTLAIPFSTMQPKAPLHSLQNGYLMYTNALTSPLPAAVPVSISAIPLQPAVDYSSSMFQPINFGGAERILIYCNNQTESLAIRIVNQNMALLWSPQMLIKRRNPLQMLPRKEIACEQANKEENVRENNEYCKKEERVTENNEPCESLSVQDEDSTSPAMLEGKSSKLKKCRVRRFFSWLKKICCCGKPQTTN